MDENSLTYKVRVGDDGRWHYVGPVWIKATTTAIKLSETGFGRAQIFVYRGNSRIGARRYEDGKVTFQHGSMF